MSVTNLAAFNQALDEFKKVVGHQAVAFQKKVALMVLGAYLDTGEGFQLHSGLMTFTPVKSGRAVGNYVLSAGSPRFEVVDGKFGPPESGEANRKAAERKVTNAAIRALASLRLGESIFITNSLPYIMVLNDGATNRTAHHMLERSLENTLQALRRGR